MPLERVGSTEKIRRIVSQMPVDWRVYFCDAGKGDLVWGL